MREKQHPRIFPQSEVGGRDEDRYLRLRELLRLCEDPPCPVSGAAPPVNEMAMQAGFFAGEFGTSWRTLCGREVVLLDAGEWNREAGPDFRGATLLLDGGEKLRGDIELDLNSTGWEAHGHSTNPDFEGVILHVFSREGAKRGFARTASNRSVYQVRLESPSAVPGTFALDPRPIDSPERALRLVELAAKFRLSSKAGKISAAIRLHGKRAALWHAIAAALGYRHNTVPMTLLAQRCGLRRAASETGESTLFGIAGFLDAGNFEKVETDSRAYLRVLWEDWWKIRDAERRLVLAPSAWKFGGARPANHPHRRVGALGICARSIDRLLRAVESGDVRLLEGVLRSLDSPFWTRRWNLRGTALPSKAALIGESRAHDILVNVLCPWMTSEGRDGFATLSSLRMPQTAGRVGTLADWLCPALDKSLLAPASVQQGILQLGADFRGFISPEELAERYLEKA